jgi:phage-related protein
MLHGFMKQTTSTPKTDKALAVQRLRDIRAHKKSAKTS